MPTYAITESQTARIDARLQQAFAQLVEFRRDLHAHPEPSWAEHRTVKKIEEQLRRLGVKFERAIGTAVIVDIPGNTALEPIIYRGDIDALPIQDTKDPGTIPYTSTNEGFSHACGHDVHTTIALAVVMAMQELQEELRAPVRVIFQPAEEVLPSGAAALSDNGYLSKAQAALAVHVDPSQIVGNVGWLTGPITASLDTFVIDIEGTSGHSARPHLSNDAIAAAAEVTLQLHSVMRRHSDPLHTAVLSVGQLSGGVAPNVIAGEAQLIGTLRARYNEARPMLRKELENTAAHAAAIHGCKAHVHFNIGQPPVRNDENLAACVRTMAIDVLGEDFVHKLKQPSMGGEDFGYYSNHMPTFLLRLGSGIKGQPPKHLHEEGFDLDEESILIGARIMARSMLSLSLGA